MFVNKLKLVPALLLVGLLAAGAVLAGSGPDPAEPPAPARADPNAAADEKAPPDPKRPPAAPVVRLVKPQPGGLDRVTSLRGVAEAGRSVHLFAGTAGVLTRVEARIGDRVKAGQLLAEIDAPGLALDEKLAAVGVNQAEALLAAAESRVAIANAEIQAAKGAMMLRQTEVTGAKANADFRKKQFDRLKELAKQGTADSRTVDEAEDHFRTAANQADAALVAADNAKSDLVVKEAKREQARAGVLSAKANVEAAKLGLEKARLAVARTRVVAPFDGIVGEAGAGAGEFVRAPGERADPAPLFTVIRTDALRLVVPVPAPDAARVEPGLAAEVTIDGFPDVKAAGKVARVGVMADRHTGTVRMEIDLPNPKGGARPGMTGTVTLNLGKGPADALRVPWAALVTLPPNPVGSEMAVYVYKGGKARLTPVRLGTQDAKEIEVLSGLNKDDLVVADPKGLAGKEVDVEVAKPK
jgi:RND family efflux transporter MFP subunit